MRVKTVFDDLATKNLEVREIETRFLLELKKADRQVSMVDQIEEGGFR